MPLTPADLNGRIERLGHLARGLTEEVGLQRGARDLLMFRGRKQYLPAVQDALAGGDAALAVPEGP